MGLSVWRETSKKLTVYRVCYTPIETLRKYHVIIFFFQLFSRLPYHSTLTTLLLIGPKLLCFNSKEKLLHNLV